MKLERRATPVDVSVIFPVYNENAYLLTAVDRVKRTLNKIVSSYEIIIAEDASTDGTRATAESLRLESTFSLNIFMARGDSVVEWRLIEHSRQVTAMFWYTWMLIWLLTLWTCNPLLRQFLLNSTI